MRTSSWARAVAWVRQRPVTCTVIVFVLLLVVGSAIHGIGFIAHTLPVSDWFADTWLAFNGCLNVLTAAMVYKNLLRFEHEWTWQERAFNQGVILVFVGSSVGYLSRIITDGGTISFGTPMVTAGLLVVLYACLRPPVRFDPWDQR